MKYNVNLDIATTHVFARKKQTFVTALGITIGVSIYLFMNSLSSGFTDFSRDNIFQNSAHLKVYKPDEMSRAIAANDGEVVLISNPQITTLSNKLNNPNRLLQRIKAEPYITNAIAQVDFAAFYNRGSTQIKGNGSGVNMKTYAAMFATDDLMIAGSTADLDNNLNGIIIGSGIAEKLSLGVGQNINVSSSYEVSKVLRIVGIFSTGNSKVDETQSYVNISTAQQFLKQGINYVTTIYANTPNPDKTEAYVQQLKTITPYEVEDWKTTNKDIISQDNTRQTMMGAISLSILLMAAFGIYNILSSTISQKIDDIAILKATGFNGNDVIRIFIMEALMMGIMGTLFGLGVGALLIEMMSNIYIGPPVGNFPITFEPRLFLRSCALGILLTLCAGYFPARKAARVDPVEIFRK
ncbi:MAG: FtsX-like permease family protein [Bacteroidota bacterium]